MVGSGKGIKWARWDRLCVRKNNGGMSFRNLHDFNLVMLGKLCWKCLSSPGALISRIFKTKYYPTRDFLNATLEHSPSYAWRGICESQVIVKRGVR